MFDPLALAKETETAVCRDLERKFYRFRAARFYGGIVGADCVGCNLRCLFCWAWSVVTSPDKSGKFYTPQQVADRIIALAQKTGYRQCRISGNEPTIGRAHLLAVLEQLAGSGLTFILETNGILIGADKDYAKDLARFKDFLHVRVSLKGATPAEFAALTGATAESFELQIQALKNLLAVGVPCHPAVMVSFSRPESLTALRDRLETIHPSFYDFEEEELILYAHVAKRLQAAAIKWRIAHEPERVPRRLI